MDLNKFNSKFPFTIYEAEDKKVDSEKDDKEDTPKFPKKTKVDLEPEEQIEQHY